MQKVVIICGMILLLTVACTDIYEPEIELVDNHLVVEALITNQPGRHAVRLTRSSAFGRSFQRVSVRKAKVYIIDSKGNEVSLEEESAGTYLTPPSFAGEVGESYVLHIETSNGMVYQSDPQELMPPLQVDQVTTEPGIKLFFLSSSVSASLSQEDVQVGKIFFTVSGRDLPRFRFNSILLLDYIIQYPGIFPTYDFCWIRRSINDYLDKDIGESPGSGQGVRHQVGFVPAISQHLPMMGFPIYMGGDPITYYGSFRVLLTYLYSLNDEAYHFHDMRNRQLDDEGRFFDPIAAQLPGNIHNVSNPEEVVFGFFEVSSVTYTPVRVKISPFDLSAEVIHLVDTMSTQGCLFNELPPFLNNVK
jgi:hypothetical protein